MLDYLRDPAAITRRSFEIIAAETDLSALPADLAAVAMRIVHACGMPDVVADLAFSADAAAVGQRALALHAPILCDVRMVAAGIATGRLSAAHPIHAAIEHVEAADLARRTGQTRSAAGMELLLRHHPDSIVVVGNAPTALFRLLELVADGAARPALVLGFPGRLRRRGGIEGGACGKRSRPSLHHASRPPRRQRHRGGGAERPHPQRRAMTAWLSIVGIGEDGLGGLTPAARTLVETAEVLIGGKRHLAMVPESNAERRCWPTPLLDLVERIPAMRGRRVCVLATGDPMHFGIGATLATCVPSEETTIVPNLSAFSLAAARLQWPLESAALLTLHGRPVEKLALHVAPRARLLILSADRSTPTSVARWLVEHGFGESRMIALAHMGGAKEARHEATACDVESSRRGLPHARRRMHGRSKRALAPADSRPGRCGLCA